MTDRRLRVSPAADRVITHDVLDDLTELDRHTQPVGDRIAMRLHGPLTTLTGDRETTVTVIADGPRPDRAVLPGPFHDLGLEPGDLHRMSYRIDNQRLSDKRGHHGVTAERGRTA
jgi:hypothetical protein